MGLRRAGCAVVVVGPGADPGQFRAAGVGLVLGALGLRPQVGAQLLAFADGLGAEVVKDPLRVGACPLDLGAAVSAACARVASC